MSGCPASFLGVVWILGKMTSGTNFAILFATVLQTTQGKRAKAKFGGKIFLAPKSGKNFLRKVPHPSFSPHPSTFCQTFWRHGIQTSLMVKFSPSFSWGQKFCFFFFALAHGSKQPLNPYLRQYVRSYVFTLSGFLSTSLIL